LLHEFFGHFGHISPHSISDCGFASPPQSEIKPEITT